MFLELWLQTNWFLFCFSECLIIWAIKSVLWLLWFVLHTFIYAHSDELGNWCQNKVFIFTWSNTLWTFIFLLQQISSNFFMALASLLLERFKQTVSCSGMRSKFGGVKHILYFRLKYQTFTLLIFFFVSFLCKEVFFFSFLMKTEFSITRDVYFVS